MVSLRRTTSAESDNGEGFHPPGGSGTDRFSRPSSARYQSTVDRNPSASVVRTCRPKRCFVRSTCAARTISSRAPGAPRTRARLLCRLSPRSGRRQPDRDELSRADVQARAARSSQEDAATNASTRRRHRPSRPGGYRSELRPCCVKKRGDGVGHELHAIVLPGAVIRCAPNVGECETGPIR